MTVTPASGTYLVWFTGSVENSSDTSITYMSIYAGGAQNAASQRRAQTNKFSSGTVHGFACVARVTVNGAEAIQGMWRVTGGTATMYARCLTILKVA